MKHKINMIAAILGATVLLTAESSRANNPGFYVGASAGYSALNTPSGDAFDVGASDTNTLITEASSSSDKGGFGGSLFAGYNINQKLAVELGYTSYGKSDYSTTQNQYANIGTDGDGNTEWALTGTNNASIDYNTYSVDLFLKGSMPVIAKLSAFAKVGMSYVNQSVDYSNPTGVPTITSSFATPASGTNHYTAIRPAAALGFSMQVSEHFSTAIFAQGFLGRGDVDTDSSAIASAYLVGASLTYDFL